jgi:haloalkane dehalogenase
MTNNLWYEAKPTFLDVGHSRMSYWRVGAGPDVLFIHGWPLHAATFRDVVPKLAGQFTCHVIDLPGAGKSEWDRGSRISLREHAASVRRAVDLLGLARYGVVSHDSGGAIARLLAADDSRVAALVMGNSEIPGYHPPAVELYVLLTKLRLAKLLSAALLGIPALRRSSFGYGGCFHDVAHIDGEFARLFIQPMLRSSRVASGQQRLLADFDWSVLDSLDQVHARMQAPVHLVWGADDPFFPLPRAEAMMKQFAGGATLSVLRPGKLFVHEEFPDAFVAASAPFLARHLHGAANELRRAANA